MRHPPPRPEPGFPSDERAQRRNLILFAVNTGLFYLAAPVLLVGLLQAALCERLGASKTVANLPGSLYLLLASTPVFVAWRFPHARQLRHVMVVCYLCRAGVAAAVVAALLLPVSDDLRTAAVVLQGAVTGATLTTATMFLFEALQRGVAEKRRGLALALGYGVGPALAVIGSLAAQLFIKG